MIRPVYKIGRNGRPTKEIVRWETTESVDWDIDGRVDTLITRLKGVLETDPNASIEVDAFDNYGSPSVRVYIHTTRESTEAEIAQFREQEARRQDLINKQLDRQEAELKVARPWLFKDTP